MNFTDRTPLNETVSCDGDIVLHLLMDLLVEHC
jgi:hypothetical protein